MNLWLDAFGLRNSFQRDAKQSFGEMCWVVLHEEHHAVNKSNGALSCKSAFVVSFDLFGCSLQSIQLVVLVQHAGMATSTFACALIFHLSEDQHAPDQLRHSHAFKCLKYVFWFVLPKVMAINSASDVSQ